MSAGQPLLNINPFQHAHQNTANGLHHHHHSSTALDQSHGDDASNLPMMDPSQYGDFSFSYANMPNLDDQSLASFDASSASDHFGLHSSSNPAPVSVANMNSLHAAQAANYGLEPDYTTAGLDSNEEGALGGGQSPTANSVGDAAPDDYGVPGHGPADGTDLGGKGKDEKAETPAWSELKTKAGKDRKRLPLACIACRRKKIRCSGEKPSCKHCLRSHIPCVYKVTSRKAAPRTDYMAMLDKRLKRMEERIIKIVPKPDDDTSGPQITRATVKPSVPSSSAASKNAAKKRRADEAFSPDFEAWANAPSKSKIGTADAAPTALDSQEKEESKLFREGIDALPPKELQEHLAEVFFDSVYGQAYYLLHKPSFMRKLKNDALPPVLVLSVCAVSARFASNPALNNAARPFLRGEEWASQARDICTRRYEWPNITILTCLLILGLHEFGTCHGGRSWALGGQAIRMAFALQLHRDLDHDPQLRGPKAQLSFVDREIRRRIMWACFLMDRFTSSGTDRPMFIKEESISIPLPVSERHFQLDMPMRTEFLDGKPGPSSGPDDASIEDARNNMGAGAFSIRALALWGRIVQYHNHGGRMQDQYPIWNDRSDYAKLVRDIDELLRTLPSSLQYSKDNLELHITENTAAQFLFLHMAIQQDMLYINQAASSAVQGRGGQDVPKDFIPRTTARTFAAANRISQLLKDAEERQCFVSAPFAGYCAFLSTSVQILAMVSGNQGLKAAAEANCAVNIKYLKKMMKYWGMFHWMVEDIRRQYKAAHDTSRRGGANATGPNNMPLLQYADWFNRYPHGIGTDVDFFDPGTSRRRERGDDAVLEQKPELQSVEEFFTTLSPAAQNSDARETSKTPMQKRKPAPPPKKASTGGASSNKPEQQQQQQPPKNAEGRSTPAGMAPASAPPPPSRRVSEQAAPPQLHIDQRRFSSPGGGGGQAPMGGYNPHAIGAQSQGYMTSMSPISPNNMAQYPPQPASGQMPFFADIVPLNMANQENGLSQQMFGIVPGGMGATTPVSENVGGWQNMSNGQNNNNQGPQQGRKMDGGMTPGAQRGQGQQHGNMGGQNMNIFGAPMDGNSWFMPYDTEPPEMNQEMNMHAGGMDAFGAIFGGASTNSANNNNGGNGMSQQNHMGGRIQHGL